MSDSILSTDPLVVRLIKNTDKYIFHEDTATAYKICTQHLGYLGNFENELKDKEYKIMTYSFEWGINCKVTSRVLVYSDKEYYLGNYYTSGLLPTQLFGYGLLIEGKTVGDFSKGVPDSLEFADNYWVKFEGRLK